MHWNPQRVPFPLKHSLRRPPLDRVVGLRIVDNDIHIRALDGMLVSQLGGGIFSRASPPHPMSFVNCTASVDRTLLRGNVLMILGPLVVDSLVVIVVAILSLVAFEFAQMNVVCAGGFLDVSDASEAQGLLKREGGIEGWT